MKGIAKIKVEDLQKASKIHTKSHRKWDRNNQRKIIPKSIQNGPEIHSKSTKNASKNEYVFLCVLKHQFMQK